mgnify:CR=1 FL=1
MITQTLDSQPDKKVSCMKKVPFEVLYMYNLIRLWIVETLNSWQPLKVALMDELIFMKLKMNNIAYLNASHTLYIS